MYTFLFFFMLAIFVACLVVLVVTYVRAFRELPRYKRTDNQTF